MGCGGDAAQPLQERMSGGVEELVGNAEDAAIADGAQVAPVALGDNAFERDAVPCSAPGEEEDVGVGGGYFFGGGVGSRRAEVEASGGFDEFGDPGLGVDERLAPFFAVDDRGFGARGTALAGGFETELHLGDK